mmetsp:Transcript_36064/g.67174  ORF Transcript_36064/g.67174 Transcript_36064/m.67174 type:complete len:162 (+) Transcript_36064:49-534(+)
MTWVRWRHLLPVWVLLPDSLAVQRLDDATFEHQTQASTGMTTGSWLVLFGASGCEGCSELLEALDGVEEELRETYVIPAHVDREDSAGLWQRFGIQQIPSTLLFAKHKLYRYSGNKDGASLLAFAKAALDGQLSGAEIPPPPSFMDVVMNKVRSLFGVGEL